MWQNYFKTAFRNLKRHRFYTLNNLLGLALGFCAALYIFQYTRFEQHFDDNIPAREQKVRLIIEKFRGGEQILSSAETYVGCGPSLYAQIPEIEDFTHTFNMAVRMNSVISYEPNNQAPISLKLKDYYYADSSFLKFFGYELLEGNRETALSKPNTAVITESLAKIYFGDEDPMGKILRYRDEDLADDQHVITGVMKDPPANTHLPFSLLLSYSTFDNRPYPGNYETSWKARKSYTYFKLAQGARLEEVTAKFPAIVEQNTSLRAGDTDVLKLQPVAQLHFSQDLSDQPTTTVNPQALKFFRLVALLILLIASINFINLSTSSLVSRSGEVGVRKILGAARGQLIFQYYIQCALINSMAMVIAVILLYLGWPYFNGLSGSNIPESVLFSGSFVIDLLVIGVGCTLGSGVIPALIIASFNPIKAIAGTLKLKSGKTYRHILIVGQFIISFCLVMGTLIIFKQLNFMQSQNLGVDIDQVLVVRVPGILANKEEEAISNHYRQFINKAKASTSITDAAVSLTIPGHERAFRTGVALQSNPDNLSTLRFNGSGPDFLKTYRMHLLAGRNFKMGVAYDQDSAILLSESAAKALGFNHIEDAIGTIAKVPVFRLTCEVVGVVNDYRLSSVKSDPEPMAFLYFKPAYTNFFSFRIQGSNPDEALRGIQSAWSETFPGNPLDYFFLNDFFNRQYQQERKLTHLFVVFGGLAMILAALGLLGLSAYTVQQRTKEIGVRKVMGSSVFQIFTLLSLRLVGLVALASAIGAAFVYYFSDRWLNQFPLQTQVPLWLYTLPLAGLVIVTLLAISYQTIKAAHINPVESLRYE